MAEVAPAPIHLPTIEEEGSLLQDEATTTPEERHKILSELSVEYDGWEEDLKKALATSFESEAQFKDIIVDIEEKQRTDLQRRSIERLSQLDKLVLTYPGHEEDAQAVEEWNLKHGQNPGDDTSEIFQEKLDGLENKQRLFKGDRTHPHIIELDSLGLSYPGWEDDYHLAIKAHCNSSKFVFQDALHSLRERQHAHDGIRSHWRLVQLDKLNLTYHGWEQDVKDVEEWHFKTSESAAANKIFAEVLEGMKDQEQIYLGWDFRLSSEESSVDSAPTDSDTTLSSLSNVSGKHYKLVEEGVQIYEDTSDSLAQHEERRKEVMEQRLSNPASRHHSGSKVLPPRSPKYDRYSSPEGDLGETSSPTGVGGTVVNIGHCVLCRTRPTSHVFVPCGHLCACAACSHKVVETTGACPICRIPCDKPYRVFFI